MTTFSEFGLESALTAALTKIDYLIPTPIQLESIPIALLGQDILGSAQTGTGKTAAFSIPLINFLLLNPDKTALILSPTRELAMQIHKVIRSMIPAQSSLKSALLIGGEKMGPQFHALRRQPPIVVGTPGRVKDHLLRGSLDLRHCYFLVLDETDRMLHMGFEEQLTTIFEDLPLGRQTLMFSATLPAPIIKLSQKHLSNPSRIAIGSTTAAAVNVKQEVIHTTGAQKDSQLLKELDQREGRMIIFVKTQRGADKLAEKLQNKNHSAYSLHGGLPQRERDRVIKAFRENLFRILVATDVAARGLDLAIDHVINYDLPHSPEDFIHRIGRTGRAGANGCALSLIEPEDHSKWRAIERMFKTNSGTAEPSGRSYARPKKRFGRPSFPLEERRPSRHYYVPSRAAS